MNNASDGEVVLVEWKFGDDLFGETGSVDIGLGNLGEEAIVEATPLAETRSIFGKGEARADDSIDLQRVDRIAFAWFANTKGASQEFSGGINWVELHGPFSCDLRKKPAGVREKLNKGK